MRSILLTLLCSWLVGLASAAGDSLGCDTDFDVFLEGVPALFVYLFALLVMFFGIAIVTDEYLVPALQNMSFKLGLSEDVSGATLMASASSAPELFISLAGTFASENSVGVGTIVGSAIFNILVIIAFTGVYAPDRMQIDWKPFTRDVFFYCTSIVLLMVVIDWDGSEGEAEWWEGLYMFLAYGLYVLWMAYNETMIDLTCGAVEKCCSKKEADDGSDDDVEMIDFEVKASSNTKQATNKAKTLDGMANSDMSKNRLLRPTLLKYRHTYWAVVAGDEKKSDAELGDTAGGNDDSDFPGLVCLNAFSEALTSVWIFAFNWTIPVVDIEDIEEEMADPETTPERKAELTLERTHLQNWPTALAFTMSVLWIGALCWGLVTLADKAGCIMGIDVLIMGVTFLAAGTSVPDALASISAAKVGSGDQAVANAIGSNVFDILIGLGLPWFLYGVIKEKPFVVSTDDLIMHLIPLVVTVFLVTGGFILSGWYLGRCMGMFLATLYGVYCVYAVASEKLKE